MIVTLWALVNALIILRAIPGSSSFIDPITPLRIVLSVLMMNTGWVYAYKDTFLPINTTMWFVNVLLLCYLLYYLIGRLAKKQGLYIGACALMVLIG